MSASVRRFLKETGLNILHDFAGVTISTFIYGLSIPLFAISIFSFLDRRGGKSRANYIMFYTTILSFLLATLHWGTNTAIPFIYIPIPAVGISPRMLVVINQIKFWTTLVLQLTSDGTMAWRAWVISVGRQRWLVFIPLALLLGALASGLAFVSMTTTYAGISVYWTGYGHAVSLLYASVALSTATNIISTALIGYFLWSSRKVWRDEFGSTWSYAQGVLLMIFESGVVYGLLQISTVILFKIRAKFGSKLFFVQGTIWLAYVQLTAIYPTVVLLLINQKRSMSDTIFSSSVVSGGSWSSSTLPGINANKVKLVPSDHS